MSYIVIGTSCNFSGLFASHELKLVAGQRLQFSGPFTPDNEELIGDPLGNTEIHAHKCSSYCDSVPLELGGVEEQNKLKPFDLQPSCLTGRPEPVYFLHAGRCWDGTGLQLLHHPGKAYS